MNARLLLLAAAVPAVVAQAAERTVWHCPMHPEVQSDHPGKCPKCGMTLQPMEEMDGMDMQMPPLMTREGSGTSWLPDSTPMFAHHFMPGDWMVMLHYQVLAGYDDQWSDRGARRFLSENWVMGMASHSLLGGTLELRSMLSLEPATAGGPTQIPLLLQSGETYGGEPLHDKQHPHDLFMEVAAIYRHPLAGGVSLELYAAPSGEPALGPTAFMHRASAMMNPFPPIGHHWQDATHISFPVLTAGLYTSTVKVEGSAFHGREPDENRWDFDLGALDSFSGRVSVNPTDTTSFQVSYGKLHAPEGTDDVHRVTASAMWNPGSLALTAVWGRNVAHGDSSDSLLAEARYDFDGNVPFARLEWVQKDAEELVVADGTYGVSQAVLGFAHKFTGAGPVVPFVGAAVNLGNVPDALSGVYGTSWPIGAFVFVGIQPEKM